ncbi:UvrD-helicase domain-containing protein [Brucella tritici]|uniref:DNA 3'-5' helicase II n=1 Tax=Brucella tritici TaxID=94626 RepID=A0A6L3YVN5_9HYPH|nr:UvrD-helicase domain-containing protein [Brucella tritici]KAB2688933.1 AAA family ATPase [Brucella tritici]
MNSISQVPAGSWDKSQELVIRSDSSARLIVEAGPGTGKTAVSCARLAHLVSEHGVQPSKSWMISFTRTAVAEIRSRLYNYLGEAAFAVKVATVDSHAWSIHSGYDSTATLTGTYEENIDNVLSLIRTDPEVQEYLDGVEHLIVDEAQDLVGNRADLVEAIIKGLNPDAGVTVFADEAQAIYGFSEEAEVNEIETPLLERIRGNSSLGFVGTALDTVHRTSAPGLLGIFTDVRAMVMAGSGQDGGLFSEVREGIIANADGSDLNSTKLSIDDMPAGSLVLFRTRSEALEASQYCAAPHAIRLSGYGAGLPPWIALCFHDYVQSHMGKQEFMTRWLARVENTCPPDYGVQEAWDRLIRAGGAADGSLDMKRLRIRLGRYAPPVELAVQEYGLQGPVIGTIHASKGREADNVFLLMPDPDEFADVTEEEEETRVLFVGSTRARSTLKVGKARKWTGSQIESGRAYRGVGHKEKSLAMVEIGRPEDVGAAFLVGRSCMSAEEAAKAQAWLGVHCGTMVNGLRIASSADQQWNYRLFDPGADVTLGWFTPRLRDDLWSIANILAARKGVKLRPPTSVWYIKARGSRTIAIPAGDPQLEKLHEPWAQSGFLLAPRCASFTRAEFKKAPSS